MKKEFTPEQINYAIKKRGRKNPVLALVWDESNKKWLSIIDSILLVSDYYIVNAVPFCRIKNYSNGTYYEKVKFENYELLTDITEDVEDMPKPKLTHTEICIGRFKDGNGRIFALIYLIGKYYDGKAFAYTKEEVNELVQNNIWEYIPMPEEVK